MNIPTPNSDAVLGFINEISDPGRRSDSLRLLEMMREVSGEEPALWGSIVGFGVHHYKYATGREGDTVKIGFSPRKGALTLYGVIFYEKNTELLESLGKHEAGKGCLYIKRLEDVDTDVLRRMLKAACESYE
jgi:hypothetical protein